VVLVTTSIENRIWKTKIQQFENPKTTSIIIVGTLEINQVE